MLNGSATRERLLATRCIDLAAGRLGHALHVAPEDLCGAGAPLVEVCPSSNVATLRLASLRDHPRLGDVFARGFDVPLCLCTDDTAVFDTDLAAEYLKVRDAFGLELRDLALLVARAADRAARRFYDRARASWGGTSWDLRRGKTGAETLAPQICEPGNPNARYTVLCVEIYVDSDDNTPVMAFRWFYKKSDLDKKLGADVDAKDELVLARSIHSTPLEYVRGAVVVHDSDGPAKAAGPKGKRAPVFFCTRDYDERKKKLYKRQL